MYPWGYARIKYAIRPDGNEQTCLTLEEIARLTVVRARYRGHPACVEFDLDERRLAFAHWLVDRGWFWEDMG